MNRYNEDEAVSDPLDLYLGLFLKNWLAQQPTPALGKVWLFSLASEMSRDRRRNFTCFGLVWSGLRRAVVILYNLIKEPVSYKIQAGMGNVIRQPSYQSLSLARQAVLHSTFPAGMGI